MPILIPTGAHFICRRWYKAFRWLTSPAERFHFRKKISLTKNKLLFPTLHQVFTSPVILTAPNGALKKLWCYRSTDDQWLRSKAEDKNYQRNPPQYFSLKIKR